mgnify:CR=1 FL=1
MLKSSSTYHAPSYSHGVHSLEGITRNHFSSTSINHIIDIILELKVELPKIKIKVKEIKKQLSITSFFS